MPRKSEKSKIIDQLVKEKIIEITLIEDIFSENEEELVENALDELYEDLEVVTACRKGVANIVPKSLYWHEEILTAMNEDRFRQMLRVNRSQFHHLISLIANCDVFKKCHGKQLSIELQLAIVLYRLGSCGESASIGKVATTFGISDGGTLNKITNRVFRCFLKLLHHYIYWPDSIERSQIVGETIDELPYCIGYVDGTEIKLATAPATNHENYFSRCHVYSIKAQVVCDYKLKIRDVVVGYCGSSHDSKMLTNCEFFQNRDRFFCGQQWLAGDSAYPLSNIVITPYRTNAQYLDAQKRKQFNLRHSRFRVRVEHCFGILKGRFCSLKELRMRIHNETTQKFCNAWVLVCCILHNILLDSTDAGEFEESLSTEPEISEEGEQTNTPNNEMKRQMLYNLMFE